MGERRTPKLFTWREAWAWWDVSVNFRNEETDQAARGEGYCKLLTTRSGRARCAACGQRLPDQTLVLVVLKSEHGGWTWAGRFMHRVPCVVKGVADA